MPTRSTAPPPAGGGGWFALPAGRRLKWVTLAVWACLLIVAVPLMASLGNVQRDDLVDFLPASAESTRVAVISDDLPGGETTELIVVYRRAGGLTPVDLETIRRHHGTISARYGTSDGAPDEGTPGEDGPPAVASGEEGPPGGATGGDGPPAVLPSEDGTTAMFQVSMAAMADERLAETVAAVRSAVDDRPSGLTAQVTGPAGIDVDIDAVFDGVDTQLMLVTVVVVAVLLILTYRSPSLWLVPLAAVGAGAVVSMAVWYLLVEWFNLTVSTQSASITTVLLFGAGTDYALLLVSRYREELRRHAGVHDAMAAALRGAGPAVLASAGTITLGLLCLVMADLNSNRGLGPVGAAGIVVTLLAMLTLFPAILVTLGRRVFWPAIPTHGSAPGGSRGLWARAAGLVGHRPVATAVAGVAFLTVAAVGVLTLPGNLKENDSFVNTPESVAGFETIAAAYPEMSGQPLTVLTPPEQQEKVVAEAATVDGVREAMPGRVGKQWAEVSVFPSAQPETEAERATVRALRAHFGAGILVGGPGAQALDLQETATSDRYTVIPLVLGVVLLVLVVLLRSLVAPLLLVGVVLLTFLAALGAGAVTFDLLGFEGADANLALLCFVFLVALGVDYGIFLLHRVREDAARDGTPAATTGAIVSTGAVIASAGVVLAATFAVLTTLPMVEMVEVGIVVAVGVLLQTLLAQTLVVPGVAVRVGEWLWWPGRVRRTPPVTGQDGAEREPADTGSVP